MVRARREELPVVWSSEEWIAYYSRNLATMPDIPWENGAEVVHDEIKEIRDSLRAWQLGETSEGKNLLAAAWSHAEEIGDPDYVTLTRLFIAEEQGHGELLGRYLDLAGVSRAKKDLGDSLFRWCRHFLATIENWTTIVVMVETHAMVYYNAIRRATGSKVLKKICERLLKDEVAHLRFQCERLAILHHRRHPWLYMLTMLSHRILFLVITLAIWVGHRRALRAGGYRFGNFWQSAWSRMEHCWRLMNPARYAWPSSVLRRTWLDDSVLTR